MSRSRSVLIVDDDDADCDLARQALRAADAALGIDVVHDGAQALRFVCRKPPFADRPCPGLVLLDLNMPGMDGREFLRRARAEASLRRLPVVVFTTSDAETDCVKAYELGANAYLTKPMSYDLFNKTLQGVVAFWFGLAKLPPPCPDCGGP